MIWIDCGEWGGGREGGRREERQAGRRNGGRGMEGEEDEGERERDNVSEQLTPQHTATAPHHTLRLSASHSLLTTAFLLAWRDSS